LAGAVFLAVFAGMDALGRYALTYSIAAVAHSLFVGVVLDPLTTFGSPKSAARIRVGYSKSVVAAGSLGLVVATIVLFVGLVLQIENLARISLGLLLFMAQAQLLLFKRLSYVSGRLERAAASSTSYAALCVLSAVSLAIFDELTEVTLVLGMSLSAVVSASPFLFRFANRRVRLASGLWQQADIRRYAAWATLTSLPAAAAVQSIYWVAGSISSMDTVGQLKLFEQIMMPIAQFIGALLLLDQVRCAVAFREGRGEEAFRLVAVRMRHYASAAAAYVVTALAGAYFAQERGFGLAGDALIALSVYGGGMVLLAVAAAANFGLKGARRPELIAVGYAAMAALILSGVAWVGHPSLVRLAALVSIGWSVHCVVLIVAVRAVRRAWMRSTRFPDGGPVGDR
jgi:hypothetical protein